MITLDIINTTQEEGNNLTIIPAEFDTSVIEQQDDELYYEDGEEIEQQWQIGFVVLAYVIAFLGSYSAIRLLEHGLWRSERERDNATTIISRYPKFATAFVLGMCAVWSMHMVGMQAVVLDGVNVCYNWAPSLGSMLLSVTGFWAGVRLASNDIFAGEDRVEILKHLLAGNRHVSSKLNRGKASHHIHMVALFHKLHWIAVASVFAAVGALSMHYVGMISVEGPFRREWNWGFVGGSALLGAFVCFAAFWILFRPLHWKVEKGWYRVAAAGVMAAAVCLLHFLGMLSVTYVADSNQQLNNHCSQDFQGWRPNQLQVLCVVLLVPCIAFYVEHTISNELRVTYRQLLDIRLTGSQFMDRKSKMSHFSTAGSTMTRSSRPFSSRSRSSVKISGLNLPPSRYDSNESIGPRGRHSMLSDESAMSALSEHQKLWNRNYTFEEDKKSAVREGNSSDEEQDDSIERAPEKRAGEQQSAVDDETESEEAARKGLDVGEQQCPLNREATAEETTSKIDDAEQQQQFSLGQEAAVEEGTSKELRDSSKEETTEDTDCTPQPDDAHSVTIISTNADLPLDTPTIPEDAASDSSYFEDEASVDLEAGHDNLNSSHQSYYSDYSDSDSGYSDSDGDQVGSFDDPDSLERFKRRESVSLQGLIEDISRRHSLRHSLRQSMSPGQTQSHRRARRHHSASHALGADDSDSSQSTDGIKPMPLKAIWDGSKWVVDGSRAFVDGTTQVVMGGSKKVGKMVVKGGKMAGKGITKASHAAADTAMAFKPLRRSNQTPETQSLRRSTGHRGAPVQGGAPFSRSQTVDSARHCADLGVAPCRTNVGDFSGSDLLEGELQEVALDEEHQISNGHPRWSQEPFQTIWEGPKWVVDGSKAIVGETTQVVMGGSKKVGKMVVKGGKMAGKGISKASHAAADTAMAFAPLRRTTHIPETPSLRRSTGQEGAPGQAGAPFGRSQTVASIRRSGDVEESPSGQLDTNAPDLSASGVLEGNWQEGGLDGSQQVSNGRPRRSIEPLHAIWEASTAVVDGSKAIVGETTQVVMGGSKKVGKIMVMGGAMASKSVVKGGAIATKGVVMGGAMATKGVVKGGAIATKGISKASHAAVDTAGNAATFATPFLNFILMDENQGRRRRSGHCDPDASGRSSTTSRGPYMDYSKRSNTSRRILGYGKPSHLHQVPERHRGPRRERVSRRDRIQIQKGKMDGSKRSMRGAPPRDRSNQCHLDESKRSMRGQERRRPPTTQDQVIATTGRREPSRHRARDHVTFNVGSTRQLEVRHHHQHGIRVDRGHLGVIKGTPPAYLDLAEERTRRFSF
ncbi:MHYT domain signaling protein [Seminavis robusta]|uniref:MHYT domain signaling protein n=1 Tax=Seminavis robusta TaxID=568900 RepID=A0A9N8E8N6_9STRA|nr:MHYT domain signaling protein [Seminavis robusta]|eukprot:Sro668_g184340.1 MHYT domain signaling protein (1313) ;mRNA; f:24888-28992